MPRLLCLSGLLLLSACSVSAPPDQEIQLGPESPRTLDPLELVVRLAPGGAYGGAYGQDSVNLDYDLEIRWTVDGAPVPEIDDEQTVPTELTAKDQLWRAQVRAVSGGLHSASVSAELRILNTPPSADLSLDPVPQADQDLVASAIGSDVDDDAVSFTYSWTVNGQATSWTTETVPASATTRGELWVLTAIPNDGEEDGEPVSATASIANVAPEVLQVEIQPSEIREATVAQAVLTAQDTDGDPVSLSYAWQVNGVTVQEGAQATLTGERFSKGESIQVLVTPNDGFVDGETLSSDAVVVLNTAPSTGQPEITGNTFTESDTLTCTPQGWQDIDGDAEGFLYAWSISGTEVATTQTTTGADFDKGDALICCVTPHDGEDPGTAQCSEPLTVLNTPPVLSGATLSTTSPAEGDTLSMTLGSATDADGDPLSYRYAWYVDGVLVGTGATLDSDHFDKGQSVYVVVTPNDGEEDGASVTSDTATVVNTLPQIDSLSLSPSAPVANESVTATASTSDADGDTVSLSYAWTLDGVAQSESGATFTGSSAKGQVLAVVVTPNDGEGDGSTATSSVSIVNTPPGAPSVSVTPETAFESEDLVCSVDTESVDVDGDTVTYSFAWTVDGVAYTGSSTGTATSDTIDSGETEDEEEWVCTVTPDDGDAAGSTASASAQVIAWETKEFGSCGDSGRKGPSQDDCEDTYDEDFADEVTVNGGIQSWTVPATGTYEITAAGAQGASGDPSYSGGLGAELYGEFSLTKGEVLYILVGQQGEGQDSGDNGGGGGGSFVYNSSGTLLIAAGGGGGARVSTTENGCDALTGQYGGAGSGGLPVGDCAATGTPGEGGAVSASSYGSAGAGWNSDGDDDETNGGGQAIVDGGDGGKGNSGSGCGDKAEGGFGGGGSGRGCYGGGGGGGYSGGEGGWVAGGGGSYNGGSNTSASSGAQSGDGAVVIDLQ